MSKKGQSCGSPARMATFADMVTLLMAFFVLLLAFSEMDIVKYKAISGSMKRALGVKADSMEITLPDGQKAGQTAQLRGQAVPQDSPPGSPEAGSMQKDSQTIEKSLEREIKEHKIEVVRPDRMLIRLPASETFASGRATINPAFLPVLRKIRATSPKSRGVSPSRVTPMTIRSAQGVFLRTGSYRPHVRVAW